MGGFRDHVFDAELPKRATGACTTSIQPQRASEAHESVQAAATGTEQAISGVGTEAGREGAAGVEQPR
jgi:hypothetical protein